MSLVPFFDTDLAKLRGMTPAKLTLLQTELGMFTYGDLIQYFPFRYEDRTVVHPIASISDEMDHAQFVGRIRFKEKIGAGHRQRIEKAELFAERFEPGDRLGGRFRCIAVIP